MRALKAAAALAPLLVLLVAAGTPAPCRFREGGLLPDPACTPGARNPVLSRALLCSADFRTGTYRHVTRATRRRVLASYGVSWADRSRYEVDHLIPLEVGGSNRVSNLWPEAYPVARWKDARAEGPVAGELCRGELSLEQAQRIFTSGAWLERVGRRR